MICMDLRIFKVVITDVKRKDITSYILLLKPNLLERKMGQKVGCKLPSSSL